MISHIRLKFGRTPGAAPEEIALSNLTVFVGPNNSGKSKVLSEITEFCASGRQRAGDVIVDGLGFLSLTRVEAQQASEALRLEPSPSESVHADHIVIGARGERHQIHQQEFQQILQNPATNPETFCRVFLRYSTLLFSGTRRINLVDQQPAGDFLDRPRTSLQALFRDDLIRREIRRIVHEAFDTFLVIDPTFSAHLRLRLSQRAPADEMEERGIHKEAIDFHAAAQPIESASDGIKAFTGILIEALTGDPRVLLIDEPEAFLHPSLAFKLGNELGRASLRPDKRVILATHSAMFTKGCIQSGAPVNIVRLTYRRGAATARVLPNAQILDLMRNPLLRSSGVLNGLFYEFVVVTEGDTDRAFYEEINERLLRFKPEWGIPNCLFVNAQNKQTIHTIVSPLRQLGIPTAALVDVDFLSDAGADWSNLIKAANVPSLEQHALSRFRTEVSNRIDQSGKDLQRDGGISILTGADLEAAENLLGTLKQYGIFVVPRGEVEDWLPNLRATGQGARWLVDVFRKMGTKPEDGHYELPTDDDVWRFNYGMKEWFADSNRRGIPD
jgi:ABC-type cobalamin/Fe3+-siderophores transport system ATPase subunit